MQPAAPAWGAWGQAQGAAAPPGAQQPLYAAIEQAPFGVLPKIMKDEAKQASATPAKNATATRARPASAYTPYSYKITPRSAAAKLLPRGSLITATEEPSEKSGKALFVARSAAVKKLVIDVSEEIASPLLNRDARNKITGAAIAPSTPLPGELYDPNRNQTKTLQTKLN